MLKTLFVYAKYPSVAGIMAAIWIGSGVLLLIDNQLPVLSIVVGNMIASLVIGFIGFRVDKK